MDQSDKRNYEIDQSHLYFHIDFYLSKLNFLFLLKNQTKF
jgi:hypothetical protein